MPPTTTLLPLFLLCTTIPSLLTTAPPHRPPRIQLLFDRYPDALEAIFGIGLRSSALLADPSVGGNVIVSPVSITLLLSELMLAADGKVLKNIASLLSLRDSKYAYVLNNSTGRRFPLAYADFHVQLKYLLEDVVKSGRMGNFTLRQSSAVFYDSSVVLKEQFRYLSTQFYETELRALNFTTDPIGSLNSINKWAEMQTRGLIKSVLPSPPTQPSAAIFANALYFLAEWETPFSDELNHKGQFSVTKTESVDVTYMLGYLEQVKYAETDQYKMVCLPYKNEEMGMYILLPKNEEDFYNIKRFQLKLNESELIGIVDHAKRHQVAVRLPKMQLSTTLSILKPFQKYIAFKKQFPSTISLRRTPSAIEELERLIQEYLKFSTPDAKDVTLTKAAENGNLQVSDVVQQLTFSVNEKGTEAAAVTAGLVDYMGGSKSVAVDRPFVFFIWQETTKVLLFWGAVSDPSRGES